MLVSMTGFGAAQQENENFFAYLQIKTLNSQKGCDISFHIPPHFYAVEMELRSLLTKHLVRGKVFYTLYMYPKRAEALLPNLEVQFQAYQSHYTFLSVLKEKLNLSDSITLDLVIETLPQEYTFRFKPTQEEMQLVLDVTQKALEEVIQFRKREGENLLVHFRNAIQQIELHYQEIQKLIPLRNQTFKERLLNSLKTFQQNINFDPNRLEQELAFYLDKYNIEEELVRFHTHLEHLKNVLCKEESQGKTISFILQELWREITTLSNKANDASIQTQCVLIKELLDGLKEQAINIL